jgi:hypothetical protein
LTGSCSTAEVKLFVNPTHPQKTETRGVRKKLKEGKVINKIS